MDLDKWSPKAHKTSFGCKIGREFRWSQCYIEAEETKLRLVWPSSATYQNKAPPSLASFAQRKGHDELQKRYKSMKNGSFKNLETDIFHK